MCTVWPCPFQCCEYHATLPIRWNLLYDVPPCSSNTTFLCCHFMPCYLALVCTAIVHLFHCLYQAALFLCCDISFDDMLPLFVLHTDPPFHCFIVFWLPSLVSLCCIWWHLIIVLYFMMLQFPGSLYLVRFCIAFYHILCSVCFTSFILLYTVLWLCILVPGFFLCSFCLCPQFIQWNGPNVLVARHLKKWSIQIIVVLMQKLLAWIRENLYREAKWQRSTLQCWWR